MSAAVEAPICRRPADWEALARRLYEEDVAGATGAPPWDELGDSRSRWFALAEGWDGGRRRYERDWGDLPTFTPWEELPAYLQQRWIVEALNNPGRVA